MLRRSWGHHTTRHGRSNFVTSAADDRPHVRGILLNAVCPPRGEIEVGAWQQASKQQCQYVRRRSYDQQPTQRSNLGVSGLPEPARAPRSKPPPRTSEPFRRRGPLHRVPDRFPRVLRRPHGGVSGTKLAPNPRPAPGEPPQALEPWRDMPRQGWSPGAQR
jgi:hypothetical protein